MVSARTFTNYPFSSDATFVAASSNSATAFIFRNFVRYKGPVAMVNLLVTSFLVAWFA